MDVSRRNANLEQIPENSQDMVTSNFQSKVKGRGDRSVSKVLDNTDMDADALEIHDDSSHNIESQADEVFGTEGEDLDGGIQKMNGHNRKNIQGVGTLGFKQSQAVDSLGDLKGANQNIASFDNPTLFNKRDQPGAQSGNSDFGDKNLLASSNQNPLAKRKIIDSK
jgi:hypothetical protein